MAQHQLKYLPVEELKISPLNMRHSRRAPNVDDIYPSILKTGVHESLLVRREGQKWGVVAGRRRLYALRRKAKETGKAQRAPCAIMSPDDNAAAMEASIIENTGHQPVTEMEAYTAYGRLAKDGRSVSEIADYFGVTELKVKRILALANLHKDIRALYAADEIDAASIRALTLASDEQQAEWLRLYDSDDERAPYGRQLKDWLGGGAAITADKALFDLDTYPGRILDDLFGEHGQFEDASLFWEHQSRAIATRIESYKTRGWIDVIVLVRGSYWSQWDYVKRTKKQGGKVFVSIRHNGEVQFHEGFVTSAEHRRVATAKTKGGDKPASVKPDMSGPMAQYIFLHRHGAARASLLAHPGIALRFAVAHMMTGSALWDVRAHEMRTVKEATAESVMTARASVAMSNEELQIQRLFEQHGVCFDLRRNGDAYRLCEVFAAVQKMSEADVLRVLTFVMAETLEAGGAVVEAMLYETATDLGEWWTPDAAFFDLLRDKRAINGMVADIAGVAAAKSAVTETAKAQRQIIENRIAGVGCNEPRKDWRPGWMSVPPTPHVTDAPSPPHDAWTRVAGLFDEDADAGADNADAQETDAG